MTELDNKFEWVKLRLRGHVEVADEVRRKVIERFQAGNAEAVYEMRWLQDKDEVILKGAYAAAILERLEPGEGETQWGLGDAEAWVRTQLDHWCPETSTSPYSNAMKLAEYKALKDLLESVSWS